MRSLCSFSISYIFFLIPTGLSPVCLCFGTFGMVTRCFLTFWGECVEKLPDYVFLLPILPFWIFFPLGHFFSTSYILTLFLFDVPLPISLQYQCQLWRPRLPSLQTEKLKDKEEEGGERGFLSRWSSQKTALPTWTDCCSRSTGGTDRNVHASHI